MTKVQILSERAARPGIMDVLAAAIILTYLALGPIYWLPGVSTQPLSQLKDALFAAAAVFAALNFVNGRGRFYWVLLLLPVAAGATFLALSVNEPQMVAWSRSIDFVEPFVWLFVLVHLPKPSLVLVVRYLPTAFIGIALAVTYAIMARLGAVVDLPVPYSELENPDVTLRDGLRWVTVSSAGFSFGRTGWAIGTSVSLILGALIWLRQGRSVLCSAFFALALAGPFLNGARGGALAVVVAGLVFLLMSPALSRSRLLITIAALVVAAVTVAFDMSQVVSQRFVMDDIASANSFEAFDRLTTGRLSTYLHGLTQWSSSPIVGVGVTNSLVASPTGEILAIHNVWLRLASEGGLVVVAPALLVLRAIIHAFTRSELSRYLTPVLLVALVASMLEPSVIFGSFNNQAAFWTAVGLALRAPEFVRAREPSQQFY